jgi:hypothetical protein
MFTENQRIMDGLLFCSFPSSHCHTRSAPKHQPLFLDKLYLDFGRVQKLQNNFLCQWWVRFLWDPVSSSWLVPSSWNLSNMNSPQVLSLLRKEKQTKFYKGKREREKGNKTVRFSPCHHLLWLTWLGWSRDGHRRRYMSPTMDFDASPSLPAAPPIIHGGQCWFWSGLGFWCESRFLWVDSCYVIVTLILQFTSDLDYVRLKQQ